MFKKTIINSIIFSLLLFCNVSVYSQYRYPKPDYNSEKWKKLSVEEKIAFYNIPENILKKLSTKELILSYLDYPDLLTAYAYNSPQQGFNIIRKNFNGIDELFKREDIAIELVDFYKNMDPSAYDINWEPLECGKFIHRILLTELLLSQEEILLKMEKQDVKKLMSNALIKLELKKQHKNVYSFYQLKGTAFLIARIMYNKGEKNGIKSELLQSKNIKGFVQYASFLSDKMLSEILNLANKFSINY